MTSREQFQQEIIDWAKEYKDYNGPTNNGSPEIQSFPDACRRLYDYFDKGDSYGLDEDSTEENFLKIPSGKCHRVKETENTSNLIVILSLSSPDSKTQFFKITSKLVDDAYYYWAGSEITEVFAKPVTTIHYVEELV